MHETFNCFHRDFVFLLQALKNGLMRQNYFWMLLMDDLSSDDIVSLFNKSNVDNNNDYPNIGRLSMLPYDSDRYCTDADINDDNKIFLQSLSKCQMQFHPVSLILFCSSLHF